MAYWLFKSEPDVFGIEDLKACKNQTEPWDGIRNYQARNMMRDDFQEGDGVLFYHSNSKPPGVAGVAVVVGAGRPDPTQFDPADKHHDPKADPEDPRWYGVDIEGVRELPEYVPIDVLKGEASLSEMAVVQRGQRLSVQPVAPAEWRKVLTLGGLKRADQAGLLP